GNDVRSAPLLVAVFMLFGVFVLSGCGGANAPAAGAGVAGAGMPFTTLPRARFPARPDHHAYSTKRSLLFEADLVEDAVNVYQVKALTKNPNPIAQIHVQAGCPDGLAMDKTGTLYVATECNGNDIEEYPKGSSTEKLAIAGLSNPSGLAIDSHGALYVSTYPASIEEFAYGGTSPIQTITGQGLTDPLGLAVDKDDNLYIADFGASQVFEVKYGTTTVTPLNLQDLQEPLGVTVDENDGLMWVADGSGDKIDVYQLGNSTPIEQISGNGFPYAVAAENKGKPLDTVVTSDLDTHAVYAYKPGKYTPYATLSNGIQSPGSLLIEKP
ncbi:MAG TPA: hypothetical protein VHS56_03260, partial [Candidatus Cybelea sp.]|nr:hypothetical protein [Candidatus Cybelea sp.]